jgi:hypothetical protein
VVFGESGPGTPPFGVDSLSPEFEAQNCDQIVTITPKNTTKSHKSREKNKSNIAIDYCMLLYVGKYL